MWKIKQKKRDRKNKVSSIERSTSDGQVQICECQTVRFTKTNWLTFTLTQTQSESNYVSSYKSIIHFKFNTCPLNLFVFFLFQTFNWSQYISYYMSIQFQHAICVRNRIHHVNRRRNIHLRIVNNHVIYVYSRQLHASVNWL